MTIYCVAFIGKFNEPLYFYCNEDTSEYLHLQMMTHSCLDVIEERKKKAISSSSATFDLYLGQLFNIEDYRIFGLLSNSHNKTIVICDNSLTTDSAIVKEVIFQLNTAFVNAIQNPFQPIGSPLLMKSLDQIIHRILDKYNNNISMKRKV